MRGLKKISIPTLRKVVGNSKVEGNLKTFKRKYEAKLEFLSVGEVWIFSGTTQYINTKRVLSKSIHF